MLYATTIMQILIQQQEVLWTPLKLHFTFCNYFLTQYLFVSLKKSCNLIKPIQINGEMEWRRTIQLKTPANQYDELTTFTYTLSNYTKWEAHYGAGTKYVFLRYQILGFGMIPN